MSPVFYYLLIRPLSHLSLRGLYLLSLVLYFLLYRVISYRKKLVLTQLRNSFPDKSQKELTRLTRAYFRHLVDLILEVVKCFHISKEEVIRRGRLTNPEIFEKYYAQGRNLLLVGGHYNNWELLAISLPAQVSYQVMGLYKPLSDKFINRKLNQSREKYGMVLITKSELKEFVKKDQPHPYAVIFGADQSPTYSKKVYWMDFLSQRTAVAFGAEKYAVESNLVVLYGKIDKVRRGYYELTFIPITENPTKEPYGFITEAHTRILEKSILQTPAYWIWSHRRWKRTEN